MIFHTLYLLLLIFLLPVFAGDLKLDFTKTLADLTAGAGVTGAIEINIPTDIFDASKLVNESLTISDRIVNLTKEIELLRSSINSIGNESGKFDQMGDDLDALSDDITAVSERLDLLNENVTQVIESIEQQRGLLQCFTTSSCNTFEAYTGPTTILPPTACYPADGSAKQITNGTSLASVSYPSLVRYNCSLIATTTDGKLDVEIDLTVRYATALILTDDETLENLANYTFTGHYIYESLKSKRIRLTTWTAEQDERGRYGAIAYNATFYIGDPCKKWNHDGYCLNGGSCILDAINAPVCKCTGCYTPDAANGGRCTGEIDPCTSTNVRRCQTKEGGALCARNVTVTDVCTYYCYNATSMDAGAMFF